MESVFKGLLEKFDEGDGSEIVLNMIFAGCISSDTLSTLDGCKESKKIISAFKNAIKVADVGNYTKSEWNSKVEEALKTIDYNIYCFEGDCNY